MVPSHATVAAAVMCFFVIGALQKDPLPAAAEVWVNSSHVAAARLRQDAHLFIDGVALEPGVTTDVHVQLFVNEAMPCSGPDRTAFFIPGSSHTASTISLVAEEMFSGPRDSQMCQIAAVNFPGHGQSSLPQGDLQFGDLTLQHYVATVRGVLDRLPEHAVSPGAIIGHSQGAMIIQMLQADLLAEGTNLREAYGLRKAVLIAPNMPAELPWLWSANSQVLALLGELITFAPELGLYIEGPPWAFQAAWFLNLTGEVASLAPSVATIAENGWNSRLPLVANLQTLGLAPFSRPSIPGGIFADAERTALQIVNNQDDPASLPFEGQALLRYLTGDPDAQISLVVDPTGSRSATHSAMLIDELADEVRAAIELPRRP